MPSDVTDTSGEPTHVYREKELQLAAVRWMHANWSYTELAADFEATGDRMDTLGWLAGQLIAIEVKTTVNCGMIWHREDRSGSLEAKVAATVGSLYRGKAQGMLATMLAHWDHTTPPQIGILAAKFSPAGLIELLAMLQSRSTDWCFNYTVFKWNGQSLEILGSRTDAAISTGGDWTAPQVPELIGRSKRQPNPSITDLRIRADKFGVGDVLAAFVEIATAKGFRWVPRPSGLAFRWPGAKNGQVVFPLFLERSDRKFGINTGIHWKGLGISESEIPGIEAPRAGYMDTNRFISSTADIVWLLDRALQNYQAAAPKDATRPK